MANRAVGTFDIDVRPLALDDTAEGSSLGRASIDKRFHGDLEGTSVGGVLTASTNVPGSAGYVAIERITGIRRGRRTFVLQHSGTIAGGQQRLVITVVPDSDTGELAGLSGNFSIRIADGKHSYEFEYTLPKRAPWSPFRPRFPGPPAFV